MERLYSNLQEFVFAASLLEEMSSQCVCRACEVSAKHRMKEKNNGEAFKCRWQVQRHQCSVLSCTQMGSVCKYPLVAMTFVFEMFPCYQSHFAQDITNSLPL